MGKTPMSRDTAIATINIFIFSWHVGLTSTRCFILKLGKNLHLNIPALSAKGLERTREHIGGEDELE